MSKWRISNTLRQFLKDYSITEYPLNCFDLVKKIQAEGKIKLGIRITDKISKDFDASAVYYTSDKHYLLILQAFDKEWHKSSSGRRQNFTVAHELAHIFLGHLEISGEHKSREIKAEEELEANEFAGRLLMPEKLLLHSNLQGDRRKAAEAFLVSESALYIRLNNLKRLDLISAPSRSVCSVCGNNHISPIAVYCSICGTVLDDESAAGVRIIEYPSPLENDDHRVMLCPLCGNSDFSPGASFCKICGLPLYNHCASNDSFISCSHVNEANARFCECCGGKTIYTIHLSFPKWQDERREYVKAVTQK